MSAAMPGARPATLLLTPSRLHGALREQVLPDPEGDAYSKVGVAAYAGLGAAIAAHMSAASVLSTPERPAALGRNNDIDAPSRRCEGTQGCGPRRHKGGDRLPPEPAIPSGRDREIRCPLTTFR